MLAHQTNAYQVMSVFQRLLVTLALIFLVSCASAPQAAKPADIGFLRSLLEQQPNQPDVRPLIPEHQSYPALIANYKVSPDSPNIHLGMRMQCLEKERNLQLEADLDDLLILVCGKETKIGFIYLASEGVYLQEHKTPERHMYLSLFQLDQPLTEELVDSLVVEFSASQIRTMNNSHHPKQRPINDPYIDPDILHQLLSQLMKVAINNS